VVVLLPDAHSREDQAVKHLESQTFLCGMLFFIIAEVDLARESLARVEADQLCKGFTGTIRHATCTVQRDADYILAEISSKVVEVDRAIQILIKSGAWNQSLRAANDAGVDVKDAAHVEFAVPCAVSAAHCVIVWYLLRMHDWFCRLLGATFLVLQTCWLVQLSILPGDRKAFGIKASAKFGTLWFMLILLIHFSCIYVCDTPLSAPDYRHAQSLGLLFFYVTDLVFLVSGVDGIAAWPLCGRKLAQVLVGRGLRDTRRCLGDEGSVSESEESVEWDIRAELDYSSGSDSPD